MRTDSGQLRVVDEIARKSDPIETVAVRLLPAAAAAAARGRRGPEAAAARTATEIARQRRAADWSLGHHVTVGHRLHVRRTAHQTT